MTRMYASNMECKANNPLLRFPKINTQHHCLQCVVMANSCIACLPLPLMRPRDKVVCNPRHADNVVDTVCFYDLFDDFLARHCS